MLDMNAFNLIFKVPPVKVAPVTRADVMEANPSTIADSYKTPFSDELLAIVENALKEAKAIRRIDLIDSLSMSKMSVTKAIAKLKVIGAVTTEPCESNGKQGIIYHYIPE
jgi:hypothetical protein